MKNILICSCFLLTFNSCTEDHLASPGTDCFIFGNAYGFCAGDCAHLYQVRNNRLYADNIQSLYYDPVVFLNTPLPDSSYQMAKDLQEEMPLYLTAHPDTTIGCPDCHDQGLIYIEVRQNGVINKWQLDTDTNALPAEIRNYAQKISEILLRLHP